MNIATYLLRCFQMGLRVSDLEDLDEGMVMDLIIESGNDNYEYSELPTKEDFERF